MKRKSQISRNNLLWMLLNAFVAFSVLLVVYLDCGFANPNYGAAVLTVVLYFGLLGSHLSINWLGNARLISFCSALLVAIMAAFNMGAWVWAVAGAIVCIYEFGVAINAWVLAVLDLLFTAVIAGVLCGLFYLLFWLF